MMKIINLLWCFRLLLWMTRGLKKVEGLRNAIKASNIISDSSCHSIINYKWTFDWKWINFVQSYRFRIYTFNWIQCNNNIDGSIRTIVYILLESLWKYLSEIMSLSVVICEIGSKFKNCINYALHINFRSNKLRNWSLQSVSLEWNVFGIMDAMISDSENSLL